MKLTESEIITIIGVLDKFRRGINNEKYFEHFDRLINKLQLELNRRNVKKI